MENAIIKSRLTSGYKKYAFTELYFSGIEYNGTIFWGMTDFSALEKYLTVERASDKKDGFCIRFKPSSRRNEKLELITSHNFKALCSAEYFNELVKNSKYNRGEIFEKLVTEYFGQEWTKDNIPFNKAGDIEVNGKSYQIKFEKANFINEGQLMRIESRR